MNKKQKDFEKITGFIGGEELEDLTMEYKKNGAGVKAIGTFTFPWLPTSACSSRCR